jgi:hypothetical protein
MTLTLTLPPARVCTKLTTVIGQATGKAPIPDRTRQGSICWLLYQSREGEASRRDGSRVRVGVQVLLVNATLG